jgi:methylglyoxal synthase
MNRTRRTGYLAGMLTIALVAHDEHKQELLSIIAEHRDFLARHRLITTSATGGAIEEKLGLCSERVGHGPEGGDVRLAHRVLDAEVDVVIFLRSFTRMQGHEDDIRMLVRVCHLADCILATNCGTAKFVLDSLARKEADRPAALPSPLPSWPSIPSARRPLPSAG